MAHFHHKAVFAEPLPVAFSDERDGGFEEKSISAVGLILIAFVCLMAGCVVAMVGGFGVLMSLLIGWLSSFVGLFLIVSCLMLNDSLCSKDRLDAAMAAETDMEMERLRARWNQNVAMARISRHGVAHGQRH